MKSVIAIQGFKNIGKTLTIKLVRELLLDKYPNAEEIELIKNTIDIRVIVIINEFKIGIESQGDPGGRLSDSLKYFLKENCDIIVCPTRTYGKTVEVVEALENQGYEITWIPKEANKDNYEKFNKKLAEQIFKKIQDLYSI